MRSEDDAFKIPSYKKRIIFEKAPTERDYEKPLKTFKIQDPSKAAPFLPGPSHPYAQPRLHKISSRSRLFNSLAIEDHLWEKARVFREHKAIVFHRPVSPASTHGTDISLEFDLMNLLASPRRRSKPCYEAKEEISEFNLVDPRHAMPRPLSCDVLSTMSTIAEDPDFDALTMISDAPVKILGHLNKEYEKIIPISDDELSDDEVEGVDHAEQENRPPKGQNDSFQAISDDDEEEDPVCEKTSEVDYAPSGTSSIVKKLQQGLEITTSGPNNTVQAISDDEEANPRDHEPSEDYYAPSETSLIAIQLQNKLEIRSSGSVADSDLREEALEQMSNANSGLNEEITTAMWEMIEVPMLTRKKEVHSMECTSSNAHPANPLFPTLRDKTNPITDPPDAAISSTNRLNELEQELNELRSSSRLSLLSRTSKMSSVSRKRSLAQAEIELDALFE